MATEGKHEVWAFDAAEDMDALNSGTGNLHKAIGHDKNIADTGLEAIGILKHAGKSGEHVAVGIYGVMKYAASAAITAGDRLTATTSGYFAVATSGTYVNGRNLDVAVASGMIGTGLFNFASTYFMTTSN